MQNYRGSPRLRNVYAVSKPVVALGVLLALVYAGGRAFAETPAQRTAAKRAFVQGDEAFKQDRFEDALKAFQEGYALSDKPRFLLNIAHCQRKLGQLAEALASYKQFLATDPKAGDRELAEQMVAEVEPLVAQENAARIQREQAAQLAVAPAPPAPTPAPTTHETIDVVEKTPAPLYTRWYFWAGIGAVVVAGVAVGFALSGGDDSKQVGSWGEIRL